MSTQWFLTRNGETIAQYSTEDFRRAVAKRVLRPTDYVRRSDSSTYISAAEFLPASYKPRSAVPRVLGRVSAFVFAILAIWAVASVAGQHIFMTALQAVASLQTKPVGASNAASRETLRQLLVGDTANGSVFNVLSEKDPEAFETLLTHFDGSVDASRPEDSLPDIRAYLVKNVVEPRMRNLPDDAKQQMLQLNRDTSMQLSTSNPSLCITQALGRPAGDLAPYLTPELQAREAQMMLQILDATPQSVDLLPASELQALNAKVGTALYQQHGDAINLLDLENVPAGKEQDACRMFAGYLDAVLALPDAERVALIRAMMMDSSLLSAEQPAQSQVPVQVPPAVVTPAPEVDAAPPAASGGPAAPSAETEFPSGPSSPDAATSDADTGPPVDLQAQQ